MGTVQSIMIDGMGNIGGIEDMHEINFADSDIDACGMCAILALLWSGV